MAKSTKPKQAEPVESKEVAKVEPVEAGLPVTYDFGADAGAGFEDQSAADYALPFISVLQANSPQVEGEDSALKGGMLLNTVTEEAYSGKTGLEFIPAKTEHCFVEWVPRDNGGGFVAKHDENSPIVLKAKETSKEYGKLVTPAGNDLVETFYVYGVIVDESGIPGQMAVIAFTSTKIKVYRNFNTKINMFVHKKYGIPAKPPLFAHRIRVASFKDKNKKGDFYNFVLSHAEADEKTEKGIVPAILKSLMTPDDPRYQAGKQCKELVESGMAKASYETQGAAAGAGSEEVVDVNSSAAPF